MRRFLSAITATLALVSCSNGRDTAADPASGARDLSLGVQQAGTEPLVLSAVERQSMTRPASQRRGQARLLATTRTAVPRPTGAETVATAVDLAPAPAAEVAPEAPAKPVAVAEAGFGHSLAAGQTVASIPAVSMGSGDPPAIQTIASRGIGMSVRGPDDNCAPHGGVIAVNRVYQPGWRRF